MNLRAALILVVLAVIAIATPVVAIPPAGYYEVWGDEFNEAALDTTHWDYWLLGSRRDAVDVTNAVSLNGSDLVITTYSSNSVNYSAMIATDVNFLSRYGYWEASIEWGNTNGMWSALWMQSPTMGTYLNDAFVSGSEIDIGEHRSTDGVSNGDINNVIQPNVHWNGYGSAAKSSGGNNYGSGLGSGFHTYGFLWTSNNYNIYIDGSNVRNWNYANNAVPVSQSTEWFILSSEVDDTSTTWAGTIPSAGYGSLAASTTKLTVDYVRYYVPTNVLYWTGAGDATYLTNSANYVSNMPPVATSDLTFSYLAGSNLNPVPGTNMSVDGLVFLYMNNGATISGTNTLTLGAGGLDMVAANHSVSLSCPVNIGLAQTWNIGPNSPGNTLNANGPIAGTATLTKGSYGTVVLSGTNSFSGTLNVDTSSTTANDGALQITRSASVANVASPISIRNNNSGSSTLQLNGSAGSISIPQAISLAGRNTNVIAIQNISGSNTLAGNLSLQVGGANYWLDSDSGTLNFAGAVPASTPGGTRTLTFMGSGNFLISGILQNGAVGGTVNLVKTNAGTLTLSAANTFTGTARIEAGTLALANSNALQSATLNLDASDTGALSFGSLTTANLGGLAGSRGMVLTNNTGAAVTLTIGGGGLSLTNAGGFGGAGSLVKSGSGLFALSTSNTYAGSTTVNGGTLKLIRDPVVKLTFDSVSGSANGSIIMNNGTGGGALNGVIVTNNGTGASGASFVAGKVGNALSLAGDGTLVAIPDRVTSLDGSTAGVNWTLALWLKTSLAGAGFAYQGDGGWVSGNTSFYLNQGNTTAGTHAGAVRYAGGWLTGSANINDGNWHFVAITDTGGTKNIYVDGNLDTSTTAWTSASVGNQFWIGGTGDTGDGAALMNGQLDEVSIYNRALSQTEVRSLTNALPALTPGNFGGQLPATTALTVTAGGIFDLGGSSQTVASLVDSSGTGVVTNSGAAPVTLTLGGTTGTNTFAGIITDGAATNAISLVKNGAAREILSGVNIFRGPTTINAGTLLLNGQLGTNVVTVAGGKFGGNGVIAGALAVQSGALLAPGGNISTLTVSNNITLASGSTTFMELNAVSITNDQMAAGGTVSYGGTLSLTNLSGTLAGGESFQLFNASGETGSFSTLAGSPGTGLAWKFNQSNGSLTIYSTVPPNLATVVANNALQISWPGDHVGWTLQMQTNDLSTGLGTNWVSLPNTTTNTLFTATLDQGNGSVFYRLIYQ